jgi:RNA polymerase sigma factor (sigma-70 family)
MVGIFVNRTVGIELSGLIADAQSHSSDDTPAMNEIIRRFERLAQRLARSLTSSLDLRDDLANAARVGLVRAVRRHDQHRPGFPAYAETYMRGAALREYHSWIMPEVPSGDDLPSVEAPESVHDQVADRLAPWGAGEVATAIGTLKPAQRRIVEARYISDAPLSSIAQATGTTVSAVSQRLSTVHRAVETALAA